MAKTPAKTKNNKKPGEWENLAKELKSLIPKLDEEGLNFLIEQAQVHLYNMQVDALNETLVKSQERAKTAAAKSAGKKTAKGSAGFSEIKVSESGSSYYIVYKTEWIMFSKEEIVKLVQIAGGQGTDLEIKERLFNWFARERSDLLRSAGIANKFDNKLKTLAGLLKKNFKVRK
ncbi:MAG: hypothetical protein FWG27_08285 [Treponema sp.]|nr:hypothetical protein [Treponema sp.]